MKPSYMRYLGLPLQQLFIVWLSMTLVFVALRILPGDVVTAQFAGSGAGDAVQNMARTALALDEPILQQYVGLWVNILRGDWGQSLSTSEDVFAAIRRSLPITLTIAICSLFMGTFMGLAWGMGMSRHVPIAISQSLRLTMAIVIASPVYWTATLLVFVLLIPTTNRETSVLIAILVLGVHTAADVAQITERMIIYQEHSPYVRTAFGKGLHTINIYIRHILPNIATAILPLISTQFGILMGGTVIIESIFLLPGIGTLLLNGVLNRDYTLVQGIVFAIILMVAFVQLISDSAQIIFNPRLRAAR